MTIFTKYLSYLTYNIQHYIQLTITLKSPPITPLITCLLVSYQLWLYICQQVFLFCIQENFPPPTDLVGFTNS